MPNIIEISVTAKNLTKATFDQVAAQGRAIGQQTGDEFTKGVQEKVKDIPEKIQEPLAKTKDTARDAGVDAGDAFSNGLAAKLKALEPQVSSILAGQGQLAGSGFAAKFGEQAKVGLTSGALMAALGPSGVEAVAKAEGDRSGFNFTDAFGGRVRADLPAKVEKPLADSGGAGGTKAGQAAGKGFAGGMSPLILGAFAAVATVGPAAILGATALAVIGAGALITKGNAQMAASYQKLGADAASAIQTAAAPLIPELAASVAVLDQGIATVGPELKSVFAAVAPDVTAITGGLVSLVSNILPGMASGLRAIAPFASQLGTDFGKIGAGLGGLFQQLGSGASGGMAGFTALTSAIEALLPDIGKVVATLSSGLGPALSDIEHVAVPVAGALTAVIDAIPPGVIRAAADATLALFLAFKVGTLAGIVAEGTGFLAFLGTAVTAEGAATLASDAMAVSITGLGAAVDLATGPIGILAAVTTALFFATGNSNGAITGDMDKIKAYGQAQQANADAVKKAADAATALATATAEVNNTLVTSQIQLAGTAGKAGDNAVAALSFSTAQNGLNDSLSTTIADYNLASGAASAYKTATDALFGKYQSYSDAQATFTTDLDNAAKGLKDGKAGFDVNTAAGAANYQLMSTLATANENRAEALLKETGSQQQANAALQAGAVQIDATAKAAGFSKGQIDALNLSLYGTKNIGAISVPISADTSAAINAVNDTLRYIDNQVAYIQVQTVGGSTGGHQLLAHGGTVGAAAAGGGRSGLTWVGENGPELLALPPGTPVHSNADSMRMAAAAGGGGGGETVVRLVVDGDDLIAQWIRNHVRVTAGNSKDSVQRAFGQTY